MKEKSIIVYVLIILLFLSDCGNGSQKKTSEANFPDTKEIQWSRDDLILVDVTKKYPLKKFRLQDIADVEYIPLETNKSFLCDGYPMYVDGEKIIYCMKKEATILLFDRQGKAVKKINRQGQSGEEYSMASGATFDKARGELYINDMQKKKIFVYDQEGQYKRSFFHSKGRQYVNMSNFDAEHLICYATFHSTGNPYIIISKQDGHVVKDFKLPYEKRLDLKFIEQLENGMSLFISTGSFPIVKKGKDILLNEISSDSVYKINPDFSLTPLMVKKPSVQQLDPPIFVFAGVRSDRYQFFHTVKKEYDKATQIGYPDVQLMYDKQTQEMCAYDVYNEDCPNTKSLFFRANECEIISEDDMDIFFLRPSMLLEANSKGELKGQLKEIVATLKEDDNPVLMLIKFKE
ncbi:6-bladed beta-propeller [Parabacteroides sp. Marseille-P3160]|uniref:6-bladed beta-propeller n=2 Tax=Parabacteroides sp. Marseille-P3160 TaxID=1917887 RepID=UPI0009BA8D9F|nr:6-bladed beta-propeller [Parabacteroides sp. Marseille-P3160]